MREETVVVHDKSYFSHLRSDVLVEVPDNINSCISLGCGAGMTEGVLVERGCSVVGIEANALAAEAARARGIKVLEGQIEELLFKVDREAFDVAICADVLEHLPSASATLSLLAKTVLPGGVVIISVPNFRYFGVLRRLVWPGWLPEDDAGIFDRTHVRWTTSRLVKRWCEEAGLEVVRCKYRVRPKVRLAFWFAFGLLDEFLAKQIVLVAKRRE